MTESMRLQWVFAMHACATVNTDTDREAASDERVARGHGESETQSRLTRYENDNGMICGAQPFRMAEFLNYVVWPVV